MLFVLSAFMLPEKNKMIMNLIGILSIISIPKALNKWNEQDKNHWYKGSFKFMCLCDYASVFECVIYWTKFCLLACFISLGNLHAS